MDPIPITVLADEAPAATGARAMTRTPTWSACRDLRARIVPAGACLGIVDDYRLACPPCRRAVR